MAAQALSGIAKDLTKMSAKSAIKVVVPEGEDGALFRWVARLTGSKNALKGLGFFMGGALLGALGFVGSLTAMAAGSSSCWSEPSSRSRAGWERPSRKSSSPRCFPRARRSTGFPRHGCFYSPRATSGSWSGCRSSCFDSGLVVLAGGRVLRRLVHRLRHGPSDRARDSAQVGAREGSPGTLRACGRSYSSRSRWASRPRLRLMRIRPRP